MKKIKVVDFTGSGLDITAESALAIWKASALAHEPGEHESIRVHHRADGSKWFVDVTEPEDGAKYFNDNGDRINMMVWLWK